MGGVRNPDLLDWTPQRTAEAHKLRDSGKSAREIAEALGGTTRGAVVSHLWQTNPSNKNRAGKRMDESTDRGCKTRALQTDANVDRLALRRFSWEVGA